MYLMQFVSSASLCVADAPPEKFATRFRCQSHVAARREGSPEVALPYGRAALQKMTSNLVANFFGGPTPPSGGAPCT